MKKIFQQFIRDLLEIMLKVGFDLILDFLRKITENLQ